MTLLDRYLRAVAAQLPKDSRDDIVAELRDLILNRFEAREEELGRPLTEGEQETLLREFGHPLTVAGRYGAGPGHLIGPELYPYWWFAVKVGLAAMAGIILVVAVIQLLSGGVEPGQLFGRIIGNLIQSGITVIGVATLGGFILERQSNKPKFLTDWRVKDLQFFELAALDTEAIERSFKGKPPIRRPRPPSPAANALGGAMAFTILLLWWTGLLPIADLRPGAGSWVIDGIDYGVILTGIVEVAFWPILAYLAARIALELFRAWRPAARRAATLGQGVLAAARLAGLLWLWNLSALSPVIGVGSVQAFFDSLRHLIDSRFDLASLLTLIVVGMMIEAVGAILGALWQLVTPARREAVA